MEPAIDLRVSVEDINDNSPVFTSEVFVGSVEEMSTTSKCSILIISIRTVQLKIDLSGVGSFLCTAEQGSATRRSCPFLADP